MKKNIGVVFGATGGIGSQIVKKMLEKGMHVCAIHNRDSKIKGFKEEFSQKDVSLFNIDLMDKKSIQKGMSSIIEAHGAISSIVFSVSLPIKNKSILLSSEEDIEDHIKLQVLGMFHIIKSLKDFIKSVGGIRFVVLLTEACIGKPPAGMSAYVTAKYALMGFAKSMAVELSKYSCTVNMISPGMVDTELIAGFPSKLIEITATKNPLQRIAKPDDVANAVLFLISDESRYLNGTNITVNGGGIMV